MDFYMNNVIIELFVYKNAIELKNNTNGHLDIKEYNKVFFVSVCLIK